MDLKDIISISGKSGLFSVVGKSKNNVIVESIIDKKRFPIFNSNKISALSDISIYTYDEEILLSDIYRKIFESNDGKKTILHTEDISKLRKKLEEFVPNYDKEQVYNSDIKKLFQWYNILHDTKNLKLKKAESVKDEEKVVKKDKKPKKVSTKQKPKITSNQVTKKVVRTQKKSG
ncbi:MAG: hypothetical protein CL837_03990 [Crocinitomicaceae bacterium]|jgi:hypothetical protein|nr:hypothetical protein [Crocinitomicaceae bacterium]|tara:strand:+ start:63 stop:587 length:525 start_codon:yes stop_codon:yes gene_type:complete